MVHLLVKRLEQNGNSLATTKADSGCMMLCAVPTLFLSAMRRVQLCSEGFLEFGRRLIQKVPTTALGRRAALGMEVSDVEANVKCSVEPMEKATSG